MNHHVADNIDPQTRSRAQRIGWEIVRSAIGAAVAILLGIGVSNLSTLVSLQRAQAAAQTQQDKAQALDHQQLQELRNDYGEYGITLRTLTQSVQVNTDAIKYILQQEKQQDAYHRVQGGK